jgi:hypothetical protein
LKRGVFVSVVDLQIAINRFVVEHNAEPKPLYERGVVKTLSALLVCPLDLFVRPQAPIFSSLPWCRSSTARKIAQGRRVGAARRACP